MGLGFGFGSYFFDLFGVELYFGLVALEWVKGDSAVLDGGVGVGACC